MKKRPFGPCRLCQHDALLCKSHLIAAAAYKYVCSDAQPNSNPTTMQWGGKVYSTSKQVVDYLLCEECEQRLRHRGEDWVLTHCYHDQGNFPLFTILKQYQSLSKGSRISIYPAARVHEIDADKLTYFAMSVYWRAGAHKWLWEGRTFSIELGPYLEPIRLFLLDEGKFPEGMALLVRVVGIETLLSAFSLPESRNHPDGVHAHHFGMPGLVFTLLVGKTLSEAFKAASTAPGIEQNIIISLDADRRDIINTREIFLNIRDHERR